MAEHKFQFDYTSPIEFEVDPPALTKTLEQFKSPTPLCVGGGSFSSTCVRVKGDKEKKELKAHVNYKKNEPSVCRWVEIVVDEETSEFIIFDTMNYDNWVSQGADSPQVSRIVNLRIRSLGLTPPALSPNEWKELMIGLGKDEEKACAFADKLAKEVATKREKGELKVESYKSWFLEEVSRLTPEQQDLVTSNMALANSIAQKFVGRSPLSYDDLLGIAYLELIRAAIAFDSSKGNKFSTFAYHKVWGGIQNALWHESKANRIRTKVSELSGTRSTLPSKEQKILDAETESNKYSRAKPASPSPTRLLRRKRSAQEFEAGYDWAESVVKQIEKM